MSDSDFGDHEGPPMQLHELMADDDEHDTAITQRTFKETQEGLRKISEEKFPELRARIREAALKRAKKLRLASGDGE